MSRRRAAYAVITLFCGALALPASGWASSGGSGLTPGAPTSSIHRAPATSGAHGAPATSGAHGPPAASGAHRAAAASGADQAPPSGNAQNGNTTVSTSGDGVTLRARASTMLSSGLSFSGTAPVSDAGQTIEIERSGHQTGWQWASTATATVRANGSFGAAWQTNHIGRFAIRAVVLAPVAAQAASTTPSLTVTVYLSSIASWYSDDGSRTACGEKLEPTTLGVANRNLKCGSQVALYFDGRTITVPVIDRGPYANHANWDLTQATAKALRFIDVGVGSIGAVSLPQP